MAITVSLNDAQKMALEMMSVDANELAASAIGSAIKGKLNYYRNGTTVKTQAESTHSVTRVKKDGSTKVVFYKGGLKEGATKAYQMAKKFLPSEVTEAAFVADALKDVDAVLSQLNGGADEEGENE